MNSKNPISVTYVSSAFNEEKNIQNLYKRCLTSFEKAKSIINQEMIFNMILLDNNSKDNTYKEISDLTNKDNRVIGYHNFNNYTSELSISYGVKKAYLNKSDIIIILCSDLQDPPEITEKMLTTIISKENEYDAILAFKKKSSGNKIIQIMRNIYYKLLRFSDRDSRLIIGFHGFGCYTYETIEKALWYVDNTNLNLRNSITNSSNNPYLIGYEQLEREYGKSSYSIISYFFEAFEAITTGKSLTSRISLRIGGFLFILSILIAVFVVANTLIYGGEYAGGIPTLTLIVTLGIATQVILLAMISRQIENLNISSKLNQIASKKI